MDLETVLQAAVFVNDEDGQVRTAHKILGYDPIQKSFTASKHVIRANDPWLPKITVVEHGFSISEGSPIPKDISLAGASSSHQAAEDGGDLDLSEEGFGVFDQADLSEDPPSDLGDPELSVGASSRKRNYCQWEHPLEPRWVLRESSQPAYSTSLRVSWGRVHRESRNLVLQLPQPSPACPDYVFLF